MARMTQGIGARRDFVQKEKRKLGNRLIRVMQQTATIVITGRFEIVRPTYGRLLIRTNIFVTTQKKNSYTDDDVTH